jgi:hypothetical protein
MDWLNDERTDASSTPTFIRQLFEQAIADVVISADLWVAYATFELNAVNSMAATAAARGAGSTSADKSTVRAVLDRAVRVVGSIPTIGPKVWKAYREFELDELEELEESDDDSDDSDDSDGDASSSDDDKEDDSKEGAIKAQQQRLGALFQRQLALPLPDNDAVMQQYTALCTAQGTTVPKAVTDAFMAAKADWSLRSAFEANIAQEQQRVDAASTAESSGGAADADGDADADVATDAVPDLATARAALSAAWLAYIGFEKRVGHMERAHVLLSRSVVSCYWDSSLWLQLGQFVGDTLGDVVGAAAAYNRGVRNCLWCSDLWVALLRSLERSTDPSTDRVEAIAKEALAISFYSIQDYLQVARV